MDPLALREAGDEKPVREASLEGWQMLPFRSWKGCCAVWFFIHNGSLPPPFGNCSFWLGSCSFWLGTCKFSLGESGQGLPWRIRFCRKLCLFIQGKALQSRKATGNCSGKNAPVRSRRAPGKPMLDSSSLWRDADLFSGHNWVFPKMVVPPKHPKMIIFSRKTDGCLVPPF